MLHFFKLLTFLINIDQETVLNWFGLSNPNNQNMHSQMTENDYSLSLSGVSVEPSPALSVETLRIIIEELLKKVEDGLTLSDIESILFFILFIRFVILAIKYNLKTSFYITCIGLLAGYLWYRHLIDLVSMYKSVLVKLPFIHKFGLEAVQLESVQDQLSLTGLRRDTHIHWYNPGQLIYYAFTKGAISVNQETGTHTYIDPLSMIISNLKDSHKAKIVPLYYQMYNTILPKFTDICSKFWSQLSGVAGYAVITRIGKKYCPYLIRWHWTFLLIVGMVEQFIVYFIYRAYYFQSFILVPRLLEIESSLDLDIDDNVIDSNLISLDKNLILQINAVDFLVGAVVLSHIGLILFGLFHAIWGQYFYFPFFVENTELHIGTRPSHSIYSGGNTAWQDPIEIVKTPGRFMPKLWYGWFGRGTKKEQPLFNNFLSRSVKYIIKKLRKLLRI